MLYALLKARLITGSFQIVLIGSLIS